MADTPDRPFPSSAGPGADADRPATGPGMSSDTASSGATAPGESAARASGGADVLGRVVQGAHETIDRLAETAAPHVQRLQEGLGARAGQAKEVGDEWAESLRCTVRDHPLASVLTALALGVILDRLTQR